jgi:hypothetical protein
MSNCPSLHIRRRLPRLLALGILVGGLFILGSWFLIAKAQSPQQRHIMLSIDVSGSMRDDVGAAALQRIPGYLKKLFFSGLSRNDLAAGDEIIVPTNKTVPEIVAGGLCGGSCQAPSFIFAEKITDTLTIRQPGDIDSTYPSPISAWTHLGDALKKVCDLAQVYGEEGVYWVLVSDDYLEQPELGMADDQIKLIAKLRSEYSVHTLFSIGVRGSPRTAFIEVRRVFPLNVFILKVDALERRIDELIRTLQNIVKQLKEEGKKPADTDIERVEQGVESIRSELGALPRLPGLVERIGELERKQKELEEQLNILRKQLTPTITGTPIPPTATRIPSTATPIPPTATLLPPTAAPTPPCPSNFKVPDPQVSGANVRFSWDPVAGAEKYELRVMQGRQTIATPQTTATSISLDLNRGRYQWQVAAIGRAGCPEKLMDKGPRTLVASGQGVSAGGSTGTTDSGRNGIPLWLLLLFGFLIAAAVAAFFLLSRSQWVRLRAKILYREVPPKEFKMGISESSNRISLSPQGDPAYCYDLEASEHWVERRLIAGYYLCHQGMNDPQPIAEKLRWGTPLTFERKPGEQVELTLEMAVPSTLAEAQDQPQESAPEDSA